MTLQVAGCLLCISDIFTRVYLWIYLRRKKQGCRRRRTVRYSPPEWWFFPFWHAARWFCNRFLIGVCGPGMHEYTWYALAAKGPLCLLTTPHGYLQVTGEWEEGTGGPALFPHFGTLLWKNENLVSRERGGGVDTAPPGREVWHGRFLKIRNHDAGFKGTNYIWSFMHELYTRLEGGGGGSGGGIGGIVAAWQGWEQWQHVMYK